MTLFKGCHLTHRKEGAEKCHTVSRGAFKNPATFFPQSHPTYFIYGKSEGFPQFMRQQLLHFFCQHINQHVFKRLSQHIINPITIPFPFPHLTLCIATTNQDLPIGTLKTLPPSKKKKINIYIYIYIHIGFNWDSYKRHLARV